MILSWQMITWIKRIGMKGSIKIAQIRGIKVFMHWTFILPLGWLLFANLLYATEATQLAWTVIFILAFLGCVLLHEAAHALVAAQYGIYARNLVLLPVGGIASIEKFPGNPIQELMISVAGPVINLLLALLLWVPIRDHDSLSTLPGIFEVAPWRVFLYLLSLTNLGLALFNLIPAFPLDGGRILRAVLAFRLNYLRATTVATIASKVVAILLIAGGIILVNPIPALIGIFIILSAGTEGYYLRLRSLVDGIKLRDVLMFDFTSLQADTKVEDVAGILASNHSKYFILMEGTIPIGSVNRLEIIKAIAEMKYTTSLKDLTREPPDPLDGSKDVQDVLEKLARDEEHVYPVMDQGSFAGIVTLDHIIEYLLLNKTKTNDFGRVKSLLGLMH
jgi:Zn-dependent protease